MTERIMTTARITLVWQGPESVSKTWGPLTPGVTTITVTSAQAGALISGGGWQRRPTVEG